MDYLTSHRLLLETSVVRPMGPTVYRDSLSENTGKTNHLQMSLQRQHFLLSYLKTLSMEWPLGQIKMHDLHLKSDEVHLLSGEKYL